MQAKDEDIDLLKQKNVELLSELDESQDLMKQKDEEMKDMQNRMDTLSTTAGHHESAYKEKCDEYQELWTKHRNLEQENAEKEHQINRLTVRMKKVSNQKKSENEEIQMKLQQFDAQRMKMEENKKVMDGLKHQMNAFRTKYEIEKENFDRHRRATMVMEEEKEERDSLIERQRKKIKVLVLWRSYIDSFGFHLTLKMLNVRDVFICVAAGIQNESECVRLCRMNWMCPDTVTRSRSRRCLCYDRM